jgi:hypothetical protein
MKTVDTYAFLIRWQTSKVKKCTLQVLKKMLQWCCNLSPKTNLDTNLQNNGKYFFFVLFPQYFANIGTNVRKFHIQPIKTHRIQIEFSIRFNTFDPSRTERKMLKTSLFVLCLVVCVAAQQTCVTKKIVGADGAVKTVTSCSEAGKQASASVVNTANGVLQSSQASSFAKNSESA